MQKEWQNLQEHSFETPYEVTDPDNNHQWMLKLIKDKWQTLQWKEQVVTNLCSLLNHSITKSGIASHWSSICKGVDSGGREHDILQEWKIEFRTTEVEFDMGSFDK